MTADDERRAAETAGAAGVRSLFARLAEGADPGADAALLVDLGERLATGVAAAATTGLAAEATDGSATGHPPGPVLPYGGS